MLRTALRTGDSPTSEGLAEAVEDELFRLHKSDGGKEYRVSARALSANLKRNAELRAQVGSGAVSAADLTRMGSTQLATREQQQTIHSIQEKNLKRATIDDSGVGGAHLTSDYTCPECKGTRCDYLDTTRRDIGKSDTWGAKDHSDGGRSVKCLSCGHRWTVSELV